MTLQRPDIKRSSESWKSDGTEGGTAFVKSIYGGYYPAYADQPELTSIGGELFISTHYVDGDGFDYGKELWRLGNVIRVNRIVTNTGKATTFNAEKQINPTTMTCFGDVFNNLITTVDATGSNPISGTINAKVWIDSTQQPFYVKRHYEITPTTNATTATGRITLYFTQAEFDAFNAVNTKKLPIGATDVTGIANLKIDKRGGTSSNGTGLPITYSGTATAIDPVDADIVWNATGSRWEVTFDVTGFSGFFVGTGSRTGTENANILRGGIKIYPNPVHNLLTIETTENSRFDIINLLGQHTMSGQTTAQSIDVSTLPQGTYILKIGAQQVKFVKQ